MPDFTSGKHVIAKLYFNNKLWTIKSKSIHAQEVAVEVADQVCGEPRARLQKITDYYRVSQTCYEDGSSQILQNFLANQANEDANLAQLPLAGGLLFKYLDGTKGGITIKGGCLGPLDAEIAGRTERNMFTVVYRAQYVGSVPAV